MWGILIIAAVVILAIFAVLLFASRSSLKNVEDLNRSLDLEGLISETKRIINEVTLQDYSEYNLPEAELMARQTQQMSLQKATRDAALGDISDREYLKDQIKEILQKQLNINKRSINKVIPFNDVTKMSTQDKFEHLYVLYFKEHATNAFKYMVRDFDLDRPKPRGDFEYYSIDNEDIEEAYAKCTIPSNYDDQINVLVQRVYQSLFGHDVADNLIMDTSLDGMSCGIGGKTRLTYNYYQDIVEECPSELYVPNYYDMVWVIFKGKLMRVKPLSFKNENNIMRVVNGIGRYDTQIQLSASNPILQSELKTGERIMTIRPKAYGGWGLFKRNYTTTENRPIEDLLRFGNNAIIIEIFSDVFGSALNIAVSGDCGSGKTSAVKKGVGMMNPNLQLRVGETTFEADLNNLYPERHIASFQERGNITVQDMIDSSKKLDTQAFIVAETDKTSVVSAIVQLSQSGSACVITTIHTLTTKKLLSYIANAVLASHVAADRKMALELAAEVFDIDIHFKMDSAGNHFIEYINEIQPFEYGAYPFEPEAAAREFYERTTNWQAATVRPIARFNHDEMSYELINDFSDELYEKMRKNNRKAAERLKKALTGALCCQGAHKCDTEAFGNGDI